MNFIQFKTNLRDFAIFSVSDIRTLDPGFHRRRLNEWQDKGYIKKIIKGYYIFSDVELNDLKLFEISNKIYKPSYVSFESALSYYNLIPEAVYGVTSASTKKTCGFKTSIAHFSYRTVKPSLFFGYEIISHISGKIKIAAPEKALLDYFYLHPEVYNEDTIAELRLNADELNRNVTEEKLFSCLEKFKNRSLTKRTKVLWRYIADA